ACVPFCSITQFFEQAPVGEGGFVILLDAEQRVLSSTLAAALPARISDRRGNDSGVLPVLAASEGALRTDLFGIDCFAAATKIPSLGWSVIVAKPYQGFMMVLSGLKTIFLIVAICAVMIGSVLASVMGERFLRRLRLITEHTSRVAAGNFSQRIMLRCDDELKALADSVNNMTENIAREHAGREALNQLLQSIIDPLVVTGEEDRIVKFNQSLLDLVQLPAEALLGQPIQSLFFEAEPLAGIDGLRLKMREGDLRDHETTIVSSSGGVIPVLFSCSRIESARYGEEGVIGIFKDITERKQSEQEIARLAFYDTLTGLPNRSLLMNRLELALKQGERDYHAKGEMLAVLFFDLDRFKYVNDSLGHDVGDQLLVEVSNRLQKLFRASDTLARLGGDEFVVVLPRIRKNEDVIGMARGVMSGLERPFCFGEHEIFSTTSIGIAMFPQDGRDMRTLLKNADTAMYYAKADGRNAYHFFSPEMNLRSQKRLLLEGRMRNAINLLEGFSLRYQQRVNLVTGQIIGAEALLRWDDAELGSVCPSEFIPIAEETGLILPLGEWVLLTACCQAQEWIAQGLSFSKLAVNLSGCQLKEANLPDLIESALNLSGLSPKYLELELTESMLMQTVEKNIQTLHRLKNLGITLAIDDFGTGYSSLRYLQRFPIDVLKVDKSFISEIGNGNDDSEIVRATIALGHNLNLKVVGEGVETKEQMIFLQMHSCDEAQGFLFGEPVTAEEMGERLVAQQPRIQLKSVVG
ncbi:MAG: EAL domain-containing protein, partial [Desulfuromonadaceae bacterium]